MILVFTERGENIGMAHLIYGKPIYMPDPTIGWNLEDLRCACEQSGEMPQDAKGAHVRIGDDGVTYLLGYYL